MPPGKSGAKAKCASRSVRLIEWNSNPRCVPYAMSPPRVSVGELLGVLGQDVVPAFENGARDERGEGFDVGALGGGQRLCLHTTSRA